MVKETGNKGEKKMKEMGSNNEIPRAAFDG